ncbi:MAG: InlB B-repeat-containing protein [Candidatus Saccharibacteria bacterium]|nr:InlB B-repeat-containing protein [Candidatus Saccharibacteria bacterium]
MMGKKHKILLWGMMLTLMISSMGVFAEGNASALTYSSDTDIEFTFNSVISINLSSPNLVISDLAPGEYSDSNIITVGATTNGSAGFQLSATVGQKNGTDALVNTVSSSNTFANLTTTQATLAGFSDNTWGYSYCADSSTNCGTSGSSTWVSGNKGSTTAGYAGLPLDNNDNAAERGNGGVLLLNTSGPEDTIQSVQFKIGAKASSGQASGDYTNTINFYAVANPEPQLGPVSCEAGKICYNENALRGVEGTMGKQSAGNNASVTLLASNFSRSGYGFAGWNTAYDYSGTSYGPNEDITTPANTSTNGLSLYAMWIKSTGSLQNWSGCSSLPQGSVTALTDQRDNNTYAIAKLADGNCWMIENLRLENDAAHNSDGTLAQGYGTSATYGNFSGLANPETPDKFTDTYSANSLYSNDGVDGTINIGTSNLARRMPRYNNINTPTNASDRPQNPTTNDAINTTSNASMYSYGNYYSWHAAIADTTNYSSGDHNTTSICPTGWQIPLGGTSTGNIEQGASDPANKVPGFSYLDRKMGGTGATQYTVADSLRWRKYPANFVYSGDVYNGSVDSRGRYGYLWSSTAYSSNSAYYLYLDSPYVYPGTGYSSKYYGWTVRCVAFGA